MFSLKENKLQRLRSTFSARLPRTDPPVTLTSVSAPRTTISECLLFTQPSLWYFVLATGADEGSIT